MLPSDPQTAVINNINVNKDNLDILTNHTLIDNIKFFDKIKIILTSHFYVSKVPKSHVN